ncbi:MAG: hypothetical protein SWX82_14885 [Cyanobacteriota bacterium]|nr:hypothetical protein [Cyanobacteriota bacterium]
MLIILQLLQAFNLPYSPTPPLPYSQLYNKYSTGFYISGAYRKPQPNLQDLI